MTPEQAVGRSFRSSRPYEVGREKIREFADAIADPNPAYRDPDAARALGYPDVIAPPTFAFSVAWSATLQLLADLGIELAGVVHGEQRFVYDRPLRVGDVLQTELTVEGVKSLAGNLLYTTRADLSSGAGEHVLSAYSMLVVREDAQ